MPVSSGKPRHRACMSAPPIFTGQSSRWRNASSPTRSSRCCPPLRRRPTFMTPEGKYMTTPAPFRVSLLLGTAAALVAGAWPALAQQPAAGTPPPPAAAAPKKPAAAGAETAASDKNAASYSLGVSMGDQLRSSGIPPEAINSERLAQGVRDADRKSTRLNSSHVEISYAVFCLKKKKKK